MNGNKSNIKLFLFFIQKSIYVLLILLTWLIIKLGGDFFIGFTTSIFKNQVKTKEVSKITLTIDSIKSLSILIPEGHEFTEEKTNSTLVQGILKNEELYVLNAGEHSLSLTYYLMEFKDSNYQLNNQECLKALKVMCEKMGSNLALKETSVKTSINNISTYVGNYSKPGRSFIISGKIKNEYPIIKSIICLTENKDSNENFLIFNSVKFN